jgi:hypothetical protein
MVGSASSRFAAMYGHGTSTPLPSAAEYEGGSGRGVTFMGRTLPDWRTAPERSDVIRSTWRPGPRGSEASQTPSSRTT